MTEEAREALKEFIGGCDDDAINIILDGIPTTRLIAEINERVVTMQRMANKVVDGINSLQAVK